MHMKAFLAIMVAAQLFAVPGTTETANIREPEIIVEEAIGGSEPTRVEEFKWYYRTYNGVCQKRLWSLTYGYWVTDWVDCNP